MNIELGSLPEGEWRYLTKEELSELEKSMKGQKFYNDRAKSDETID